MKQNFFKANFALFVLVLIALASCTEKKALHGFIVPKDEPAQSLTIGWYVPVNLLKKIVGPHFEPAVIKDDTIGTITIFIVSGKGHSVDSLECGDLKAAHLVIPVKKPNDMHFAEANSITGSIVCPISIVDESPVLGNKFYDFGFPTYTGQVNLDVTFSEEKYHVKASIETANGKIEINAFFDEQPTESDMVSAIFNPKADVYSFMYGKEHVNKIINGKGVLKTDGENMVNAMNLSGQPYYLTLGLDMYWDFDFIKE